MIVDDEPLVREPISEILRMNGFHVDEAEDGNKALKKFKKKDYDLVITDVLMPGMNGIELIKNIHEQSPATEAIVFSAHGTEATKEKLERMGVFGYLDKPVRQNQLVPVVQNALSSNRLLRLGFDKNEPRVEFNRERVLVVDDDPAIIEIISEVLSDEGYKVTSVRNGQEALEMSLINDYDLIILDINMPKMDGIETVKTIREQDPFTFILIISGEAENNDIRMALESGADKFLPKPFKPNELVGIINKVNFLKIRKLKESQTENQRKDVLDEMSWFQKVFNPIKMKIFWKNLLESAIPVIIGIIISFLFMLVLTG